MRRRKREPALGAIVADQLRGADDDQHQAARRCDRVDGEDPVLEAREVVGVLGDSREQQQRDEHSRSEDAQSATSRAQSPCNRHLNQSLASE